MASTLTRKRIRSPRAAANTNLAHRTLRPITPSPASSATRTPRRAQAKHGGRLAHHAHATHVEHQLRERCDGRPTIRDLWQMGAGRRPPTVDGAASVPAQGRDQMALGFLRGLDQSHSRPLPARTPSAPASSPQRDAMPASAQAHVVNRLIANAVTKRPRSKPTRALADAVWLPRPARANGRTHESRAPL